MGGSSAPAYTWQDPGVSITVEMTLDVMERLAAAIQQGLGDNARGTEIGGLLLGRPTGDGRRAVLIDDFELVTSEHLRGASYTLSPKERVNLGARLAREKEGRVAGYFRSHTRPGLYLDQDDLAVISRYFSDPAQVFLIVRPATDGPSMGGFFFWEDGDINRKSPYRQFVFEPAQLMSDPAEADLSASPTKIPELPREAAPEAAKITRPSRQIPPVSWLAVPVIAGLFLIAGFYSSQSHPAAPAPVANKDAVPPPQQGMTLNVYRTAAGLELRWDANAAAIRKADLGILWITDGTQRLRRELDAAELAAGNTTYVPSTTQVNFELQAYSLTEQIGKSVQEEPAPAPQVAANTPPAPQAAQPQPPLQPATAKRQPATPSTPTPEVKQVAAAPARPAFVEPPAPPSIPVDRLEPVAVVLPSHPASAPPLRAAVDYTEPHPGVFKRAFHRISSIGEGESGDGFEAPAPVHKVSPVVPAGASGERVDVKVYIDESGVVSRAQLLTKRSELAEPAMTAAQQWHFSPARKHNKPVASEMVLHFRF